MRKIRVILFFMLLSLTRDLYAQKPYFVDGYHGGVYGHYPMWVTQFMVDKLMAHPEWRLGLEIEPETWDTVKQKEPEAYARFAKMVGDKRMEFTNPTYAQPYCYNISGESIIRQFAYGMRKMREHFPNLTYTTYAVEEPCFTSSLPQLLKQFGFKYAVLKCPNTCWGGYTAAYGGELVNWIGPEGTAILTVPRYASEAFEENSTWQTQAWNNSTAFLQAAYGQGIQNPVGMCYQDAGWKNGPWLGHGEHIKNNSTYVTWTTYIEEISSKQSDDDWHFTQEDVLVNLMWGSQALQRIAQDVRKSENKVVMAEKISAMAYIDNGYIPPADTVDEAWRTLMLAQHHDSWIVPYNRLTKDQTWEQAVRSWTNSTNRLADDVIAEAIGSYDMKTRSKGDDAGSIRIFNTVGAKRAELVRVKLPKSFQHRKVALFNSKNEEISCIMEQKEDAVWLVFQAEVTGFGYATYRLKEHSPSEASSIKGVRFDDEGNCIIENDMYRMVLDRAKGGIIKSLIAKHAENKEFVDRDGIYGFGEISGHFYDENRFYSSKEAETKITILEDHAFLIKVKIEGKIASHPFTHIITLEPGQRRINFDLTVDWQENVGIGEYRQEHKWVDNRRAYTDDRYKLKVMFPNNLHSGKLYKNAPFDVCESREENTFFGKWEEIKHNVILNWVDLVQHDDQYGLALLSDHTTSYLHGTDYPLSLTAQYSGVGLWGMDYKITEALNMRYALIPHTGTWDEAQISAESTFWNEPLVGVYGYGFEPKDRSFVSGDQSGLEITASKVDHDAVLLRLFNAEGTSGSQQLILDFPVEGVEEVLLNGEKVGTIDAVRQADKWMFSVNMPRFGIKTLQIKKKHI